MGMKAFIREFKEFIARGKPGKVDLAQDQAKQGRDDILV